MITRLALISAFNVVFLSYVSEGWQDENLILNKFVTNYETHLDPIDFARANALKIELRNEVSPEPNILLRSNAFEGDIAGLNADSVRAYVNAANDAYRNAVKDPFYRWSSKTVPYTISSQYSSYSRQRIAAAIIEFQEKTCVRFEPRTDSDPDYVSIQPGRGCSSMVGKIQGKQVITLGTGCIYKGIIMHELMHAVGFFHEQSRPDRDEYIAVKYENIQRGMEGQFQKYDLFSIQTLNTNYDYHSIMHYGKSDFSKNGLATIEAFDPLADIGQRLQLSDTDVTKINRLYECGISDVPTTTSTTSATTAPCLDLNPFCSLWAWSNFCANERFAAYLVTNCRSACRHC